MGEGFFLGFEKQAGFFSKLKDKAVKAKEKFILSRGGAVTRPLSAEENTELGKKLTQMYRDGNFSTVKGVFDTPPKKLSLAERLRRAYRGTTKK